MKKIFSILTFVFCIAYAANAQQAGANISFEEMVHDFGEIKEADGKVTYNFKFTNTGSIPLILSNVRASCGCTSPGWSKDPIAPGAEGYVSATYNPVNRPGNFTKTITVTSNSNQPQTILTIKGNVVPKVQTPEEIYKQSLGDLRLKSRVVSFSPIYINQIKTNEIEVINLKEKPLTVTFEKVPAHLTAKLEPATIAPNETGKIVVTYDASKKNDYGVSRDYLTVTINGEVNPSHRLTVTANIQEDFSSLTPEEKANAAHVKFEKEEFNFGTVSAGDNVDFEYVFTNTGNSPLILRKVKAACGCTAVTTSSTEIAPGASSSIKASFNTKGRKGTQRKTITVITNDPNKPTTILRLTGTIEG